MSLAIDRSILASQAPVHSLTSGKQMMDAAALAGADFRNVLQEQFTPSSAGAAPPPAAPALGSSNLPLTPVLGSSSPIAPVLSASSLPVVMAGLPNGGLMANPTGNNALTGGTIPYNPNYYATLDAARELAQQLGGTVVDMRGQISNNQAEYYIDLPNGISINAGNLVAVMNNPLYQGNPGIMDHMIAEVLNNNAIGTPGVGRGQYTVHNGQISYDRTLRSPRLRRRGARKTVPRYV
jgi:hypothetical protein